MSFIRTGGHAKTGPQEATTTRLSVGSVRVEEHGGRESLARGPAAERERRHSLDLSSVKQLTGQGGWRRVSGRGCRAPSGRPSRLDQKQHRSRMCHRHPTRQLRAGLTCPSHQRRGRLCRLHPGRRPSALGRTQSWSSSFLRGQKKEQSKSSNNLLPRVARGLLRRRPSHKSRLTWRMQ